MTRAPTAILAAAAVLFAVAARAETPEETRYATELKSCDQLPEAERKSCRDRVEAKIKTEWKARIEQESKRQNWK